MHWKLTISFVLGCLISAGLIAQSVQLERSVVSSMGASATGTNLQMEMTAGEAVVNTGTITNYVFTQGFQQPSVLLDPLAFQIGATLATCIDRSDGTARVTQVSGCSTPYTYAWSSGGSDAFESGLAPGSYTVTVTSSNGCTATQTFNIDFRNADCLLKFYTGITPNGDNVNDTWIIDNIELFPNNKVSIFNRWGDLVWEADRYDNDGVVWDGRNRNGNELPDATYFFVFEENGVQDRGWIELTR